MTEEIIEEMADVFASSHRINNENNNPSDSGVNSVIIRNATKTFGSGRNKCAVLQGLNMTVKKGSMYGTIFFYLFISSGISFSCVRENCENKRLR
jgi:hypothetical protein